MTNRRALLARRRVLAGTLVLLPLCKAAAQAIDAEEVKAAYLQKLPTFVAWPPGAFQDATSPVVHGVFGSDAVFATLEKLTAGRHYGGRAIVVRRLARLDDAGPLHVLFIGPEATDAAARSAAPRLLARHVLLVMDNPQGIDLGAVVNFLLVDGRVRFELSLAAASQAQLQLSSKLIEVAERVSGRAST